MALLTGAYPPVPLGWNGGVVGYGLKPQNGLAPQARTMGDVFKEAGYKTALIGKWHLGDTPELHPMGQGFDLTYFIDKSNNQTKKLWRGRELEADPFDNRRLTEHFIKEAVAFVKSNSKNPFFLYLPFSVRVYGCLIFPSMMTAGAGPSRLEGKIGQCRLWGRRGRGTGWADWRSAQGT